MPRLVLHGVAWVYWIWVNDFVLILTVNHHWKTFFFGNLYQTFEEYDFKSINSNQQRWNTSKCEWPNMIESKIQHVPARTILSLFLQGEPPLPTIHHNTQVDLGWGGACGDVKHALNKSHLVGRTWQLSMNRIFKTWVTTALFGLWLIWYLTWHYLTIYLSR